MADTNDRKTSAYLILARDQTGSFWKELGIQAATSQEQAVRKAGLEYKDHSVFIAIPERSWKPLRVERVQTVQTKVSSATTP